MNYVIVLDWVGNQHFLILKARTIFLNKKMAIEKSDRFFLKIYYFIITKWTLQ